MQEYKNDSNNTGSSKVDDTYSYKGTSVVIITVFKTGIKNVAIVEDVNTGEQFEVFRDQLY